MDDKIICYHCNEEIIIYYEKKYNGHRGKCVKCMINFPLD